MLAENTDLNDVAIYWPRHRMIRPIRRAGRCPSFCVPRRLRVPGGRVALVDERGSVRLVFRVARIEEGVSVIAADGKRYERGAVLVARAGTMRSPGLRDPHVLSVNLHAPGAVAYFDASSYSRILYEYGNGGPGPLVALDREQTKFPARRYPLFANNIAKTLSQPERSLVHAYASWIGDITLFAHHALKRSGLYTDLFIPRCWTLFEAKASTHRRVLREAIGQLYDYQRHYDRSPRLAVLLPERPLVSMMELFQRRRIIAVWRSRRSSFSDSAGGVLTNDLRNLARSRNNAAQPHGRSKSQSSAKVPQEIGVKDR